MMGYYVSENKQCVATIWTEFGKENAALLSGIQTYPKFRNQGLAREVLKQILDDADREGITLYLSAQAATWDNQAKPGLTQYQLIAWYARHGFSFVVGGGDPSMVRYPRPTGP